jgi:DNA-binding MarR family transcriptional regulator
MPHHAHHHTPQRPVAVSGGENLDPATLSAFQAMGRLFHLHRQAMTRQLSGHERHHGEVVTLRLLAKTDGISQRDLAETMHLSRPRVTSIVQGLERAGAVRREADPADRRLMRVFLTEEGCRQEMKNRAAFEEYLEQTIGRLDEDDKLELTRLLDEISEHLAELVCTTGPEQDGRRES